MDIRRDLLFHRGKHRDFSLPRSRSRAPQAGLHQFQPVIHRQGTQFANSPVCHRQIANHVIMQRLQRIKLGVQRIRAITNARLRSGSPHVCRLHDPFQGALLAVGNG